MDWRIVLIVIIPLIGGFYVGYKFGYSDGFFKAANIALKEGNIGILREVVKGLKK